MVRAMQDMAIVVREGISAEVFRDFFLAIAAGKDPRVVHGEGGELYVTCPDKAVIEPTLAERASAMKILLERGHGQAAQSHHIEASVRTHVSGAVSTVDVGVLEPAKAAMIRDALRGLLPPSLASISHDSTHPHPPAQFIPDDKQGEVVDAEFREVNAREPELAEDDEK